MQAFPMMCSQQTALPPHRRKARKGYKLTLKMPCYLPVMQFAHSSALRATLYRAYVTRASDQADPGPQKFDNTQVMNANPGAAPGRSRLAGLPAILAKFPWYPRWLIPPRS
jgi:oligopeptidase A